MKRMLLVAAVAALGLVGVARAATEAEKRAAIDAGLVYLAQTQTPAGYWNYGGWPDDTAATGAAVLAFEEQGFLPGQDVVIGSQHFGDVVGKGLNFLMTQAQPVQIFGQPAGNPDSDGNGLGVKFVPGGQNGRDTYVTGLVLPAIAASGVPDQAVTVGPLAGWTFRQVVRNTVDYFAFGQNDGGTARGGWRYYANSGDSDNSTSQWPVIGMSFAGRMGVGIPQFVKDELKYWIRYIQYHNPSSWYDGASGYDWPGNLPNEAKTGGMLVEMRLADYLTADPDLQAALGFINRAWQQGANGWDGNFGHPYAMWGIYKGLQSNIGVNSTGVITNLHPQTGNLDLGDTWNWYEDYCEYLYRTQSGDGHWDGYWYWTGPLATAWNINILRATEVFVPLPAAVWAGLVLLGGMGGKRMVGRLIGRRS
jgi:hypothetical protein